MGTDLSPKITSPVDPWPWVDLRGKLPGREDYASRSLDEVRYLVLHHSGVAVDSTAQSIADYHVNSLGWPGIGYSWLVHWDSRIEYVGEMQTARANVWGRNRECVGICLPGLWLAEPPPEPALHSLSVLLRYLLYLIPGRKVVGHGEISLPGHETSCPGQPLLRWRDEQWGGGA